MSLPREFEDLVEALPRILFSLQPLDALRLGFVHLSCHVSPQKEKPTRPEDPACGFCGFASLNRYTTFLSPDHVAPQQHTLQVGQQQQVWQQDCITELTPKAATESETNRHRTCRK